jgi:hypothetical protein
MPRRGLSGWLFTPLLWYGALSATIAQSCGSFSFIRCYRLVLFIWPALHTSCALGVMPCTLPALEFRSTRSSSSVWQHFEKDYCYCLLVQEHRFSAGILHLSEPHIFNHLLTDLRPQEKCMLSLIGDKFRRFLLVPSLHELKSVHVVVTIVFQRYPSTVVRNLCVCVCVYICSL